MFVEQSVNVLLHGSMSVSDIILIFNGAFIRTELVGLIYDSRALYFGSLGLLIFAKRAAGVIVFGSAEFRV